MLVAIGGVPCSWTLLFGEDQNVLVQENVPDTCTLPPDPPTGCELALPDQFAPFCHWDLKSHTHVRISMLKDVPDE